MIGFVICLALVGDTTNEVAETAITRGDVKAAARRHRIQLYNLYRTDREQYDARIQQARKVEQLSQRLDRESERQASLVAWFEKASDAANQEAEVPSIPDIPDSEFAKLANSPKKPKAGGRSQSTQLYNLPFQPGSIGSPLGTHPTSTRSPNLGRQLSRPSVTEQKGSTTGGSILSTIGQLIMPLGGSGGQSSNQPAQSSDHDASGQESTQGAAPDAETEASAFESAN